ncbi:hypothetical protein ACQKP0_01920 [Heyndrickxia sp. NPDC080065]|uniref:hypothetical protein n=1 Tax=Heyndrickxia sp. NPDC080065 TaxID=3390568 RepID=UPI003CFDA634
MKHNGLSKKLIGYMILLGAVLIIVSTVLHPLTINPWDGLTAFQEIKQNPLMWEIDHSIMLFAVLLWLIGLFVAETELLSSFSISRNYGSLFIISLTIWVLILCMELTALPILTAGSVFKNSVFIVWKALFAFGLLSGYIAVILTWIGVSLFCMQLKIIGFEKIPVWIIFIGFFGGWIGVIGIIISLCLPTFGVIVLPITSGIPLFWTILLGWRIIDSNKII